MRLWRLWDDGRAACRFLPPLAPHRRAHQGPPPPCRSQPEWRQSQASGEKAWRPWRYLDTRTTPFHTNWRRKRLKPGDRQLTTCQSWSRLPHSHLEGIIPGPDSRTHAEWLSAGVGKRPPGELDVLALEEGNTSWLRATRHDFKTGKHHVAPSPASAPARPA